MLRYAGIGSRETPGDVQAYMTKVASKLYDSDYMLVSGGAGGADQAFELGSGLYNEIIYPRDATFEAMVIASNFHPNWEAVIRKNAEPYHGRNVMIILGRDLVTPVDFVVCWTRDGKLTGGTALGIRVAEAYNIPVYNLGHYAGARRFNIFMESLDA